MNKLLSLTSILAASLTPAAMGADSLAAEYDQAIRPILAEYCNKCHSTEKQKGELDLERFAAFDHVKKEPEIWQKALDQMADGEMPPKEKPQLSEAQKNALTSWIGRTLDQIGRENAGDPGAVVMRRLSNAEYTATIRDLTGVPSLDPAREFPVDGAAGEGFTNAGAALVMSPALLGKYLDAAKDVASHAVLLPDRIAFSDKTSPRDWTEEKLGAIREFYARYTITGGAQPVNLQGIQFDTNAGGRLPVEKYLAATLADRDAIMAGAKSIATSAADHQLNAKYLGILWQNLTSASPSLIMEPVRKQWRQARPEDAATLTSAIGKWQQALWRFTTVGHIGKRDGPAAWQVPVTPLAATQEVRLKLTPSPDGGDLTLYLTAADAGDGSEHDFAVWANPRIVAPGRPDLPLRDLRGAAAEGTARRQKIVDSAEKCLTAAAEAGASPDKSAVAALAAKHAVDPAILGAWMDLLGIGAGEARIDSCITGKTERAESFDFVKGWSAADALSVVANASDKSVRIPGNLKAHGFAMHPSPKLRVAAGWRSPVKGSVKITGKVQHAHPECGNGVTWLLEWRRGNVRQRLASGVTQGGGVVDIGTFDHFSVEPGDLVSFIVGPRDGNHSCDLTALDLTITPESGPAWDLAADVSPDILAGNPHADRQGHPAVWHFYSEPDAGGGPSPVFPQGSILAKWHADPAARAKIAADTGNLLRTGAAGLAKDAPDAALYRLLTSLNGPLVRHAGPAGSPPAIVQADGPGLDPQRFGRHPDGSPIDAASLCVRAPEVLAIRIPAELAEGGEFVATGSLHEATGAEGSVQMQAALTPPASASGPPVASASRQQGGKGTWSDGERPVVSDAPILVRDGSEARKRITAQFDEFRQAFPVALCYTKIVPVDEVVTLTLFYREDDHLKRLMLDDAGITEVDRLWNDLHFVSQDALTLVDAYEQLWQFATQDADPSAFTPMGEPIRKRAEAFRKLLVDTEPVHVQAVCDFARHAWRRPLLPAETDSLKALYRKLRDQDLKHDAAVRMLLAKVLVTPAFLYRGEQAAPGPEPAAVSDWELATRLSYFLWSSAPDAELQAQAAAGRLTDPAVLIAQTKRMLGDARIDRFAEEFGCQWLHVRDVDTLDEKSERHFPTFNALRGAMKEECVRFFSDLFRGDRSVMALLDADYTFVNGPLAKHYGLDGLKGEDWQRIEGIKAKGRGGILGFAATLAKQSGASRTSPILRGNWFCETLLGERLPKPPKGVPVLPEEAPQGLTERQMIERHSSDSKCYGCHARIDPYGYALEGYDAIGRFRTKDAAGLPVDASVKFANGVAFEGLDGLRSYLLGPRRDQFVRHFCRKLLGYALGRSIMLSDNVLLDEMVAALKASDYRVSAAIECIVRSRQFRMVRGNV